MTPEEALAVAERVVGRARGGEELEAVVTWSLSTEVRAHRGSVEHFVSAEEAGIGVRIVHEGRTGLSWAGTLEPDALESCVLEARDNARFGTPDTHAGLAEPDGVEPPALDLADAALATVPADRKVAFALDLDSRLATCDARIVGHEGADYADVHEVTALASTTGIRAAEEETAATASTWALASDGEDTSTGFGLSFGRTFGELDAGEVVEEAVRRCTALLGARKARSERLTVVMDPYVSSQFLGIVAGMLSAEEVLRGRSPFAGRVGEQVGSGLLTLVDDPTDPGSPTAGRTDGEGLATRRVPLFAAGRLEGYLHNAYTARSMGTGSTGSALRSGHRGAPGVGPRSVCPEPGEASAAEVASTVGDGLLVTELVGLHSGVNPTSGDLSVGVEGRRLRAGEAAEPVREVTIASSVQRMLADVVAVGDDLRRFPWEAAGVTLAVADVTMSGT